MMPCPRPTCGVVFGDGVDAARFADGLCPLGQRADVLLDAVHGHNAEPTSVAAAAQMSRECKDVHVGVPAVSTRPPARRP